MRAPGERNRRIGSVMKFAMASYGTRATSSPAPPSASSCSAAGIRCGWPSRATSSASSSRAASREVPYGRIFAKADGMKIFRTTTQIRNPITVGAQAMEPVTKPWAEAQHDASSLADGADLLLTANSLPGGSRQFAEHYDIPLLALHALPDAGQWLRYCLSSEALILPAPLVRSTNEDVFSGCIGV